MKRKPEATLNDLEAYIGSLGEEPLRLIERELKSWGKLSYEELITLIEQGRLNDFPDWQEKYSELINDVLSPLWMGAAIEAARRATKNKIILSDSMVDVKAWLRSHGGELIAEMSSDSRRAISNILLLWQERLMNPRRMAQQIRPLIGLNAKQAEANANYRERLYQRYRDGGLNPTKAAAKADAAALRYASKQHRYRAETIVHTELAYAYNNGQDIGIRRAIAGNFIGKCELVWRTAGTNRVCGRCMELKDKVIGTTDEQGVTLPPLHPRCRCVIEYREIIGGNMRPEPNKEPPPRAEADSDLQRFSTYEENKERFSHHDLPHGIIRVTRTLLHAAPYAVTEIVNKKGGITRNFYDENGNQYLQISNNDHDNVVESKYGTQGEHAHDYVLTPDKKGIQSRKSREIYDYERERNGDIL